MLFSKGVVSEELQRAGGLSGSWSKSSSIRGHAVPWGDGVRGCKVRGRGSQHVGSVWGVMSHTAADTCPHRLT